MDEFLLLFNNNNLLIYSFISIIIFLGVLFCLYVFGDAFDGKQTKRSR
jgi:hypothetical protein